MAVDVSVRSELLDERHLERYLAQRGALVRVRRVRVVRVPQEGLWAEADDDLPVVFAGEGVRDARRNGKGRVAVDGGVADDAPAPQVHGGGADESGDEGVCGRGVHLIRHAHLLEQAVLEHGDPIAHRQGLGLIVGHVHGGDSQPLLERGDLGAGLDAELRIQVRQRFVHKEDPRFAHDCAAHRHALALPAGERLRLPVEIGLEVEDLGGVDHALADLFARHALDLEGEAHVVRHGHVGVEGVVLEHHGDVPVLRRNVGDVVVADVDGSVVHLLQTCEHAQRGGLAAARRPDQNEEFSVVDVQRQVIDCGLLRARVEASSPVKGHSCHIQMVPSPAGTCRTVRVKSAKVSTLTRMLKTPVKIITQKRAKRATFLGRHVQKDAELRLPNANLPFWRFVHSLLRERNERAGGVLR